MDKATIKDRLYQIQAVDAAISAIKNGFSAPVIAAATGTGKSIMIARLIQRIRAANPSANIIVATHVQELLVQNSNKLRAIMPEADIGIYSAGLGKKQIKRITFAGIQSIYRADIDMDVNLLIIDEAHTISRKDASMWATFIAALKSRNPNLKIIGLTATDFRLDSGSLTKGDDAMFDTVCFNYGLGQAIRDGYLVTLKSKGTKTTYDISKVGKLAGEYNLKDLEAATNLDSSNISAVNEIIEAGANRKSWLIFCNGVKHSFAVRDEFRRRGITCETVTGETPDDERDRILRQFKSGEIKCVTNNAVWTTGVDVPEVDVIGMMRHTMSGGLLLQMAGRGTRVTIDLNPYETAKERKDAIAASSKPDCLFLDFAGNIRVHGFLDQIKGKEKGEKTAGVAPMKDCPECATICHAAAKSCPDCGCVFPVNDAQVLSGAHGGDIISAPMEKSVMAVEYLAHNLKKEEKTPCLRVKYICDDGEVVSEYICLMHQGFAKKKAERWWSDRKGGNIEGLGMGPIVDAAYCDQLLVPKKIVVKKEGKYDRIVAYKDLSPPTIPTHRSFDPSAPASAEDISFW